MRQRRVAGFASIVVTVALGTGCHSGPGEAEFMQACLNAPNDNGGEEACRCAAREAQALPPKHYEIMVLDMQGKRQEVASLMETLTFDERAQFAMQQFELVGKCVAGP